MSNTFRSDYCFRPTYVLQKHSKKHYQQPIKSAAYITIMWHPVCLGVAALYIQNVALHLPS